jgi:hypothetical protein
MTSKTIPVSTQWALEGKRPDGQDYRILACSTGELDRANFADALSRFQLGELSSLPQVSVTYARHGTKQAVNYLALAIHWYAMEGQRHADGVAQRDNQGRPTAYTSYFCLPYRPLADAAIGYLAMYEALRAITLTVADGPPIQVPIVLPTSRAPAVDDLAVRVAPLLLTDRAVCVLGAHDTSMLERLEFIDAVMELLPYGFRSRMTAATWTRATNRNHRFRLFFSSAPREDKPDHVVSWHDPDVIHIPSGEAGEYFDWLQKSLGPLAGLAELTSEMAFGPKDILRVLETVPVRHRFHLGPLPVAPALDGRPELPLAPSMPLQADSGEEALVACAEHVKLEDPARLRADINFLRRLAEGEISADSRLRYQNLIGGLGLMRNGFPVEDEYGEMLYAALFRLAFTVPLSYKAYCLLEEYAGIVRGAAPHYQLLAALVKSGMTDPWVSAIVYWHLGATDEEKLNKWLVSGQVDVVRLIDILAVDSSYAQHARIVCDVTLEYLRKAPDCYQPRQVRAALRKHGLLAHALQKRHRDEDQYQIHALHQLLKAAYPQPAATPRQDLSKAAIQEILNGPGPPPTPALLSAVLMLLDQPESWQLAWSAYIHGSVTRPKFAEQTRERLRKRLPPIDVATISASEPQLEDLTQSDEGMTGQVSRGPHPRS